MSSSKNVSEIYRRGNKPRKNLQSMRMVSTDIDDTVSVFGGAGLLEEKIRDVILEGHKNIFVVTSCVPGIIGDNTIDVVNAISNEHPGLYFRVVEADGNIMGDWEDGFVESANALLDMVDCSVEPREMTVNVLAERYHFRTGDPKDMGIFELFKPFGIEVNCRFMYESSMDDIRRLCLGKMNYIADGDRGSLKIARLVSGRLGIPVDMEPLPIGIREYRRFAEKIGRDFNIAQKAEEAIAEEEKKYYAEIEKIRPKLKGKRVLIEDRFLQNIDWLIDLVLDLGMKIEVIGVGPVHPWKSKRPDSEYLSKGIIFKQDYVLEDLLADIKEIAPDIVLSDSGIRETEDVYQMMYSRPAPGMSNVIKLAQKIGDLVSVPRTEGWRMMQ
jgi:nitrogenase molybdenum-iron protein alpha/beta subunit